MITRKRKWPYWLVAGICIVGVLWFASNDMRSLFDSFMQKPAQPVVEAAPAQRKPLYPVEQPATAAPADLQEDVEPLPPLDQSDNYARTELSGAFGVRIDDMLVKQGLIYKLVAATDSLSAANTPRKIWPIDVKDAGFKVVVADGGNDGEFYPNPENYQRYDELVNLVTSANVETIAAVYRQMYPLLQEAYVGLGYPDGYFNDRLVETIDLMLSTPEPAERVMLVRPHVLYQFADPNLEALSGGQKLLLRMGTANATKIKQALQAFRQQIVQPPGTAPEVRPVQSE